jgi:hypothetical protein
MSEVDLLELRNPVPEFDGHIDFDEERHRYAWRDVDDVDVGVDVVRHFDVSVTGLVKRFFPEFDADVVIDKMMRSSRWPSNVKYFGKSPAQIKAEWEEVRTDASTRGRAMHAEIEHFLKFGRLPSTPSVEWAQFDAFYREHIVAAGLEPFRSELRVADVRCGVPGTIDALFCRREPTTGALTELHLYDWKRSKQICFDNQWERSLITDRSSPLYGLDSCNFVHYTLQLNVYRRILERFVPLLPRISTMRLAVFHPTQTTYQLVDLPHWPDAADWLLESNAEKTPSEVSAPKVKPNDQHLDASMMEKVDMVDAIVKKPHFEQPFTAAILEHFPGLVPVCSDRSRVVSQDPILFFTDSDCAQHQ